MPRKSEFLASLHCLNGSILCSLSDLKSFSFGMIGILNHSLAEKHAQRASMIFYARKTLRGPNLHEGLSWGFPPFPAFPGLESSPRGRTPRRRCWLHHVACRCCSLQCGWKSLAQTVGAIRRYLATMPCLL